MLPSLTFCEIDGELLRKQYEGTLGKSRIGMTVILDEGKIKSGYDFYRKFLRDIPITGTVDDSGIKLRETGGGTFHLHFVGKGSEGNQPLDFDHSVGLEGTWSNSDGSRSYAVSLHGTTTGPDTPTPRCADVTSDSDAVFETKVQSLSHSILAGDKATAVTLISRPLRVNYAGQKSNVFRSPDEVLAAWGKLFTRGMLVAWQQSLPHDMSVRNGMAMLGDGEAWFDAKGLTVLNVPALWNQKPQTRQRAFVGTRERHRN
jgi:hypothetical protein